MNRPSLLVADEPTGNLDDESTRHLLSLLRDFARDGGMVLMATHDSAMADKADHKYIYRDGLFRKETQKGRHGSHYADD